MIVAKPQWLAALESGGCLPQTWRLHTIVPFVQSLHPCLTSWKASVLDLVRRRKFPTSACYLLI